MPELKQSFGAAKMNKDLDERKVPNGEYRDALNIEVVTSEGSDVGSMQTLMGNTKIISSTITPGLISSTAKCVGSIVDEKNNNLYYFVADPDNYTDYILRYNSDTGILIPIVVDKYQLTINTSVATFTQPPSNIVTHFIVSDLHLTNPIGQFENLTNIRPGMTVKGSFMRIVNLPVGPVSQPLQAEHTDGLIVIKLKRYIPDPPDPSNNGWKVFMDETIEDLNIFSGGLNTGQGVELELKADRVLNFSESGNFPFITGINIVDNILFWTDGRTEPKKIIIDNFLKTITPGKHGTDPSGEFHSFFNVYTNNTMDAPINLHEISSENTLYPSWTIANSIGLIAYPLQTPTSTSFDFRMQPDFLREEHITIIKKSPQHPPTLLMSDTADDRLNLSGTSNLASKIDDIFTDIEGLNLKVGATKSVTFTVSANYKKGDSILLRKDDFQLDKDYKRYEIILELLSFNPSTLNALVKVLFIQDDLVQPLDANNDPLITTFFTMLKQENPLYEFKLPKFAYRYKFQDNQYSTYSPFSEVAFLPSNFDYVPKDGYNLGMVNTLRSVYIMDFVPDEDNIPKDVIEIDILYKESNSTSVYLVKTIKYGDEEWFAQGSVINTLGSNYARTTGKIQITSEMVKSAIASNQLLRPWDNVPRTAKAQEITGNRLVYANYLQNYNL